jgi:hypothetical protein
MCNRVGASFAAWGLWLAIATGATAENGLTLSVVDKPAPDGVEAEVKDAVVPKAYQVSDASGVFYEFWFVPGLKASGFGGAAKETLDKVEEISVLGIAIVSNKEHHDFRDDPIDPGTYVMRLALQPKDGNHMGTAPYDTFAILVPAASDSELKKFHDHEMMVDLASENTVAEHPPIFSLQPFDEAGGDVPRLENNDEKEWEFLRLQFPVEAGGETKPLNVGLVVEGIGEL